MSNRGSLFRLVVATIVVIASVSACGGGDGSSSGTVGDSTNTFNVPDNPPPAKQAIYSGATAAALVNEFNGPALVSDAYGALNMVINLTSGADLSLPNRAQTIHRVEHGPVGGTATVEGQVRADRSGWISIDYNNYQYRSGEAGDIYAYNGQVQFRYPGGAQSGMTMNLSPLKLTGPDADTKLVGSIVVHESTDDDGYVFRRYVGNLVETDNILDASIKVANFNVTSSQDFNASGRIYDSRIGYVSVQTPEPIHVFPRTDTSQPPEGVMVVSGEGTSQARMVFLNVSFASIGFDRDGDGLVEQAIRLDWDADNLFGEPTPHGAPRANSMLPMPVTAGNPAKLDGRFSYAADGGYVHFNWGIALAPPGSMASLAGAHTATPTLTPDEPGDYLVKLEASNRTGSSSDALLIHAAAPSPARTYTGDPFTQSSAGMDAGADYAVPLDRPISLDGRASIYDKFQVDDTYPHEWQLYAPPDSSATLNDAMATRPTFTPDVPGSYYATISHHSSRSTETRSAIVTMAVGTSMHFDRPTTLANADAFAVGDIDGNGQPDVLASKIAAGTTLIYNSGGGRFAAPASLASETWTTIADLNGDGRGDLIGALNAGFQYRLQQPDGVFRPLTTVHAPSGFCSSMPIVAQLAGANRNSVLITGCIDEINHAAVAIFPPALDGVLGTPRLVSIGVAPTGGLVAADVTGDEIADLVYVVDDFDKSTLRVMAGRADGTFDTAVTYPAGASSRVTVADINGDGLSDAVLWSPNVVRVMYQQANGSLGGTITLAGPTGPVLPADINGDGRMDLIGVGRQNGASTLNPSAEFGLLIQQPGGSFANELFYPAYSSDIDGSADGIEVADINGDGIQDLLYLADGDLQVMLGDHFDTHESAAKVERRRFNTRVLKRMPTVIAGRDVVLPFESVFRLGGVNQLR